MDLTEDQKHGLNQSLNEATLLNAEVDPAGLWATIALRVLTLPGGEETSPPEDAQVQVTLQPVGRVAASLRLGRWNDTVAPVQPFTLDQLPEIVQGFDFEEIYGWEFIDIPDEEFRGWSDRLSLDFQSGSDAQSHTLDLFQDDGNRFLQLRIWFDDLNIRNSRGAIVPLDDFIAGGKRWWDAMYSGDSRTAESLIFPLKP
jgi:hypothetical protein